MLRKHELPNDLRGFWVSFATAFSCVLLKPHYFVAESGCTPDSDFFADGRPALVEYAHHSMSCLKPQRFGGTTENTSIGCDVGIIAAISARLGASRRHESKRE